jgi:hypothetical protein
MGCRVTDRCRAAQFKPSIFPDTMEQDRHGDHRLRHHEFLPFILGEGGDVPLISISVASFLCLGAGPGTGYLIHGSLLPRTPGSSGLRVSCCT